MSHFGPCFGNDAGSLIQLFKAFTDEGLKKTQDTISPK